MRNWINELPNKWRKVLREDEILMGGRQNDPIEKKKKKDIKMLPVNPKGGFSPAFYFGAQHGTIKKWQGMTSAMTSSA